MNTFQASPVAAASPAALPSPEVAFKDVGLAQSFQGLLPACRELRNRQWETLKPLIKKVYIDQGKPFPYLAKLLREEHGFGTTKKQFSRKVEQWGFWKNVSRSERTSILLSLPKNENTKNSIKLPDSRVKSAKLRNWKKRYGREVGEMSSALPVRAVRNESQELPSGTETQISPLAETVDICVDIPNHDPMDACPVVLDDVGSVINVGQYSWPFDWSTVDVPGSPGLSHLFRGLQIECANPIPPVTLDASGPVKPLCLSSSEIGDLFNKDNQETNEDFRQLIYPESAYILSSVNVSAQRPEYPWRNIDKVFCGYDPNPLTEIYVFPPSPSWSGIQSSSGSAGTALSLLRSQEIRETELECLLGKFEKPFAADNPAVLTVMDELSDVYYQLGKARKAESMCRKLVDSYRRIFGPKDLRTLKVCMRVIQSIIDQRRYVEAKSLICNLRQETFKLLQPQEEFAILILYEEAWLAERLQQARDAERLYRETLQITLAAYGPRHRETVRAMSRLGCLIAKGGQEKGDILLRTAVQLSLEDSAELHEKTCLIMSRLGYILQQKGSYQESHDIAAKAVKCFKNSLGAGQKDIFYIQSQLAWNMYNLEKLDESENIFRDLASLHSQNNTESDANNSLYDETLSSVWAGLGHVLLKKENIGQATGWFEKSFQYRLFKFGGNDLGTREYCNNVAHCYETQKLYHDVLKLYRRMIDEIRKLESPSRRDIAEYESKILRIEAWMRWSTDSSTEESEDSDEIGWTPGCGSNSSTEDEEADSEADRNNDDCKDVGMAEVTGGEGEPENNEDWKTFISD